jgi:hypothetical protein
MMAQPSVRNAALMSQRRSQRIRRVLNAKPQAAPLVDLIERRDATAADELDEDPSSEPLPCEWLDGWAESAFSANCPTPGFQRGGGVRARVTSRLGLVESGGRGRRSPRLPQIPA